MPYFEVGDTKGLAADVVDAASAPANALTVTLTITKPDGTVVPGVTVANPPAVTGHYVYDYPLPSAGLYSAAWLFTFTGGLTTAHSEDWHVSPTASGAILSLAAAKEQVNIDPSVTEFDEEIRGWLGAATGVIERHTGKAIVRTTREDYPTACGTTLFLAHRPVLSLTSITSLDGATTYPSTSADVHLHQSWGRLRQLQGARWYGDLKITYVVGMSIVPPTYVRAAAIIFQHLWDTQRQPTLGPSPFDGEQRTFNPDARYAIPPRALELLGPPGLMVA